MTTATLTLAEFLLARIAEDEAVARAVPELRDLSPYGGQESIIHALHTYASEDGYPRSQYPAEIPAHYSRHDPARVLAECEAKRRIVEEERWRPPPNMECDGHPGSWMPHGDYGYGYCMEPKSRDGESSWTIRHLAAIYSDHPDYRPEWKP